MAKIESIRALEILDSRGFPTVAAAVILADGSEGSAAVPSGASTGEHEAVELRDGDKARYFGKGVLKAVANVNGELAKVVKGLDAADQAALDAKMIAADGTPNKGRLGANAILAVSMAAARAQSVSAKLPLYAWIRKAYAAPAKNYVLPAPMLNVINGGKHADSGLDVQEFMIVPTEAASFSDALRSGAEIYQILKKKLAAMKMTTAVGDEGGFAPRLKTHAEALDVLTAAIAEAGYAGKVRLALDCAASEYYKNGKYVLEGKPLTSAEIANTYDAWATKYGIISIEDPLDQDDWEGWKALTERLGAGLNLVGDDLFVTNPERLARGIKEKSANSILIKLNQIGTVTETATAITNAQKAGFSTVISHRSGETEDSFIADLAVAVNAGAIKTGAPCRSERLAKYNRLLQIEAGSRHESDVREKPRLRLALRSAVKDRARRAVDFVRAHWGRLLAGLGLFAIFFGNGGFRSLARNWFELRRLNQEIVALERDEKELDGRLKALRAGDGPVERLARRELGYIKKGEIEYRFPPPEKK